MNDERPAANSTNPQCIHRGLNGVGIVGVGLIGGSIAAALKQRKFAGEIIGVGRSAERLDKAREAGLIDNGTTDLIDASARCNLLIFCTPVDRIVEGVTAAAPHCCAGTLITDAGSVKESICRELSGRSDGADPKIFGESLASFPSVLPESVTFIGSHPLAGSEKTGFEHAEADLFVGRVCVVTPEKTTPTDQLARLTAFWETLGLTVLQMSAAQHDRAVAETSHLPHVVAAALASVLSERNRQLAATGFADATRIAAGDPDLWAAILLANADALVDSLNDYAGRLDEFRTAVRNRDAAVLKKLLEVAKRNRDALGRKDEG